MVAANTKYSEENTKQEISQPLGVASYSQSRIKKSETGRESQIEYARAKRTPPANYIEYFRCYICKPPKKFKSELGRTRHMKQAHGKLMTEKGKITRKENDLTY